jgi:adenylate cyclase
VFQDSESTDRRAERLAVALLLVAAAVLLYLADRSGGAMDRDLFDALVEPPGEAPDGSVVVLVDDASLARLGARWPLERATWARFLDVLTPMEPAAVVLDAWFEVPAPRKPVEVALDLADAVRDGPLGDLDEGDALAEQLERAAALLDGDRRFARSIASSGRTVLGVACLPPAGDTGAGRGPSDLRPLKTPPEGGPPSGALPCARPATSIPTLTVSARDQGVLNVSADPDGVVRRYPFFSAHEGGLLPSLALAAVRVADADAVTRLAQSAMDVDGGAPWVRLPAVDGFRQVRFSDVLEAGEGAAALADAIRGKAVFVGVSALGTEDFIRLPGQGAVPGIFLHAGAYEALRDGDLVRTRTGGTGPALAWAVLLLVAVLGHRGERLRGAIIAALAGGLVWTMAVRIALANGVWLPAMPVYLGLAAWLAVRIGFAYARGRAARQRADAIRRAFQHYLAPPVVQALIDDPTKLSLGGERRDITAFFSDVKGFTTISESLDPQDLVMLLNECLGAMTEIIIEEGGTVDKYIGDAIVAMWGAPLDQPDHAERACRAALRCQEMLERMRPVWIARGLPEVRVRIGLNSGPALVGNMGSTQRFDYTMLGDTVNQAARLEGANGQYGTWLMAGESTVERAGDSIRFRELDAVQLKGKNRAVHVYEIIGTPDGPTRVSPEVVTAYAEALVEYRAGEFEDAVARFEALAAGGDPPSEVMARRSAGLAVELPEEWSGIYTMTTK